MLFSDILLRLLFLLGMCGPCVVIHIVDFPQLPILLIFGGLLGQTLLGLLIVRSHRLFILLKGHLHIPLFLLNDPPLILVKHRNIILLVCDIVYPPEQNEPVFVDNHSVAVTGLGDLRLGLGAGDLFPFESGEVEGPEITEFVVEVATAEEEHFVVEDTRGGVGAGRWGAFWGVQLFPFEFNKIQYVDGIGVFPDIPTQEPPKHNHVIYITPIGYLDGHMQYASQSPGPHTPSSSSPPTSPSKSDTN